MTFTTALSLVVIAAIASSGALSMAWFVQRKTGQSGWIDAIWSLSVGTIGCVLALPPVHGSAPGVRQVVVAAMVAIWALRLGGSIALRTHGAGDDPRYAQLEKEWGADFPRRLFWFLQIQAAVAFILALTVFVAAHNPASFLRLADWIGIAIFVVAVGGETLSDRQLRAFKADPANKGKVCDTGLWSVSRHPNYFFECLGWCAYPFLAIAPFYPWGWVALLAPILMYWLLVYASGIPPLEAHMLRSRGAAFRDYQARVNAFFPGWPSKPASTSETSP